MSPPNALPVKNTFIEFRVRSISEDMTFEGHKRASCPGQLPLNFMDEVIKRISRGPAPPLPEEAAESGENYESDESSRPWGTVLQWMPEEAVSARDTIGPFSDYAPHHEYTGPWTPTNFPIPGPPVLADTPWNSGCSDPLDVSTSTSYYPFAQQLTPESFDCDSRLPIELTTTWSEASAASPCITPRCEEKELHEIRKCRPCAFFHRPQGCLNAENCSFCHLCPPGELKRRRKELNEEKKVLSQNSNTHSSNWYFKAKKPEHTHRKKKSEAY